MNSPNDPSTASSSKQARSPSPAPEDFFAVLPEFRNLYHSAPMSVGARPSSFPATPATMSMSTYTHNAASPGPDLHYRHNNSYGYPSRLDHHALHPVLAEPVLASSIDPLPSTIDPRLLFGPPPASNFGAPPPHVPSVSSATREDEKENQPDPGPSSSALQDAPPQGRSKRPREEDVDDGKDNEEANPAVEPEAGSSSKARGHRTKKPRTAKARPPTTKGSTAAAKAAPAQTSGRPRRTKAELQAREVHAAAKCGQGACPTMLSSDAETYRHLKEHYPSGGPYTCSYEDALGKKCKAGPYKDLQGLQRHVERVHFGWRGFACGKCGKQFGRRDVMDKHEKCCTGAARPRKK
ncbi:hypothetical protein OH77DRAFT_1591365 [Trametes cingulata]|nr:hypothetical protein OH77DRAFT_1591365 [Trametes cingulata]